MIRRRAFSLIELLVVIAIIAVLSAMLLAAIGMVRDLANATTCASGMRQIGMAGEAYHADNDGLLAPCKGRAHEQWQYYLAAYVGDESRIGNALNNHQIMRGCPLFKQSAWWIANNSALTPWDTGYGYALAIAPPWWGAGSLSIDVLLAPAEVAVHAARVTHHTLRPLLSDNGSFYLWLSGVLTPQQIAAVQRHRGKANVLFFDGHVGKHTSTEITDGQAEP